MRVRDILHALSRVEIRGERFDGHGAREVYRAPLVYIRGASYRTEETQGLDLAHVFEEGLPRLLHLELGWYEGVRHGETGELGNNYLLLPQALAHFKDAAQADKTSIEERLIDFLWTRYSLNQARKLEISLTFDVALRRAGITNRNITRARQTLQKALDRLKNRGLIEGYTPLPLTRNDLLTVTLRLPTDTSAAALAQETESTFAYPQYEEMEEPIPEPISSAEPEVLVAYFSVLQLGQRRLEAKHTWFLIWEQVRDQIESAAKQTTFARLVQPHWQAETHADGDVTYRLYLVVPAGLLHHLRIEETKIQRVAELLFPELARPLLGPELTFKRRTNILTSLMAGSTAYVV